MEEDKKLKRLLNSINHEPSDSEKTVNYEKEFDFS